MFSVLWSENNSCFLLDIFLKIITNRSILFSLLPAEHHLAMLFYADSFIYFCLNRDLHAYDKKTQEHI